MIYILCIEWMSGIQLEIESVDWIHEARSRAMELREDAGVAVLRVYEYEDAFIGLAVGLQKIMSGQVDTPRLIYKWDRERYAGFGSLFD